MCIAQNDVYSGSYTSEQDLVQLTIEKEGDFYFGEVIVQDVAYDFSAELIDGFLQGTYDYNGHDIDIDFALVDGQYYVESEGLLLPMTKINGDAPQKIGDKQTMTPSNNQSAHTDITGSTTPARGQKLKAPSGSFSFNAPNGWKFEQNESGFAMAPEVQTSEMYLLITPHHYNDYNGVISEIEPYEDATSQTQMFGTYQLLENNVLWVQYSGITNGNEACAHSLYFPSPHGGGALIIAIHAGRQPDMDLVRTAIGVGESMTFHKVPEGAEAKQWRQALSGRQLLFMQTSGGISDRWSYDLCSDGRFYYSSNTSGLSGGASVLSYAGQSKNSGSWKITSEGQNQIIYFYFGDGSVRHFRLSANQNSNETVYLDDRRYFIQNNNACH